jgi:hypothetical protein
MTATLAVRERTAHRMTCDVTLTDAAGRVVAQIDGCENTVDASLRAAFRESVRGGDAARTAGVGR